MNPEKWNAIRHAQFRNRIKKNENKINADRNVKFKINDEVIIKDEIHKYKGQPLFKEIGFISEVLENDVYIV